jgi:ferric-dicitrate binding protein FerR (iron transport regulator)
MIVRQGLAFLLTVLLAIPAWAGPQQLGTIAGSQAAFIRGIDAIAGSTVFSGDTISVGRGGSAWVALPGGAQVQLGESSEAELVRADRAVQLDLSRGHARFRATPEIPIEGLVGDATFRAAKDGPGVGVISYLGANKIFLFAEQGNWIIRTSQDGASLTLHQGQGLEARLEPAPAEPAAASNDTTPPRKRRGVFVIVLTSALIIGGATAAALAATEGESHLGIQQSQAVLSPFVP